MARNRRRANARNRLNLEIVGLAAIALAVLCGIALAFPNHSGSIGHWGATGLRALFGDAAPLFPVLVALIGGIVCACRAVPLISRGAGLASEYLTKSLGYPVHLGSIGVPLWWWRARIERERSKHEAIGSV